MYGLNRLFYGNKALAFDQIMQGSASQVDKLLANRRLTFKCICLSGLNDGLTAPSTNNYLPNSVKLVNLGDDIKRFKIRFRVFEILDPIGQLVSFTNFFPTPFDNQISSWERARRINLHPEAYTDVASHLEKGFMFGTKITVQRISGMWIVKSFINPNIGMPLATGKEKEGARWGFDNGKPITLLSGWKDGRTTVLASRKTGLMVPCLKLVGNASLEAYKSNPAPSEEEDEKFWSMVLQKLNVTTTDNKIRFFHAWARHEGSSMSATYNPFATSNPITKGTWPLDPNMTAYNWHWETERHPNGYHWVKNFSTLEAGAASTVQTMHRKSGGVLTYKPILEKLKEVDPEFPDSWFDSIAVKDSFSAWGGSGKGVYTYAAAVKRHYKNGDKREKPISTRLPGGRSWYCIEGNPDDKG